MEDDNIFDEDDALDCILFEEVSSESKKTDNNAGCISLIVIASIPLASFAWWLSKYVA